MKRIFTDEHKNKIREALKKGNVFECLVCGKEFWRKPYAIKRGNNKFCSKDCYFIYQKGKSKSLANRRKYIGEDNPNWKGGITSRNKQMRASEEYKQWRLRVFERDDWTCRKCGLRSEKNQYILIQAHHIKPFATFPELRFEIDNGMTLCKKCHAKEPKGKEIYLID